MRELVAKAVEVAQGAGDILVRAHRQGDLGIARKGTIDLVTEADHASEAHIKAEIHKNFPDHAILAEESGSVGGQGDYRWLVDPLDGTVNFAHGIPHYCVTFAVQQRRSGGDFDTVVAVTLDPLRNELYVAERGGGALLNGEPIRVSRTERLIDSVVATGFGYRRLFTSDDNHAEFCRLNLLTRGVRRLGSAGLDLAYLACGRFDAAWEFDLNAWDMAAGVLLVEEAGGRMTDLVGEPVDLFGRVMVGSNTVLHRALSAAITSARRLPANSRQAIADHLPDDVAQELQESAERSDAS